MIPDDVKSIEKYAFYDCTGLTKMELPDSIEKIGKYAFAKCTQLNKISIPDKVTKLDEYVFDACGLEEIIIPWSVRSIEMCCFDHCDNLEDIYYKGSEQDWEGIIL